MVKIWEEIYVIKFHSSLTRILQHDFSQEVKMGMLRCVQDLAYSWRQTMLRKGNN